ncbi:S8 family serine peptidase [Desulfoluna sp.]|uniref:S8 family serine peptidase n=1 Tax=Desulfoluna sp. TaxID=2045199 RepID=UPI00262B48DE|nr:S8 family serine peptidase [Desulfoluna sp.]
MRKRLVLRVLLVFMCGLLFSVQAAAGSLTDDLRERLKGLASQEFLPVIVTLKEDPSLRAFASKGLVDRAAIRRAQDEFLALLKGPAPRYQYKHIPALALDLSRLDISTLSQLGAIARIEYDAPVHAFMETATQWTGTVAARERYGLNGEGVTVAVVDTGIDAGHAAFGDRVVAFCDLVGDDLAAEAYDDNGHGTHCAGIIAGGGDGNGANAGVAPAASLVGVKVLDKRGSGSMSTVIAGIEWCIENKDALGIDIISLSLGSSGSSDGTDANCLAANAAVAAGLVTVVAAGNSGPKPSTIGSPGAAEQVITVGAMSDPGEGGFFLADFSSRGPTADQRIKPDIAAPGLNILAPEANTADGYIAHSGTSMATPFVAGTAALLLQGDPLLSPVALKASLTVTAEAWGSPGKDNDFGAGRLDGLAAISTVVDGYAAEPLSGGPGHLSKTDSLSGWDWFVSATDKRDEWTFEVTETTHPIAVSMIIASWRSILLAFASHDFNLSLYDPDGSKVASSAKLLNRQETLTFAPTQTGTYTLRVDARKGTSAYTLDVSAVTSSLELVGE